MKLKELHTWKRRRRQDDSGPVAVASVTAAQRGCMEGSTPLPEAEVSMKTVMFIVALTAMTCEGCATGETPLSDENQSSQAVVSESGMSLREARFKAARRQRRVIYNDDSEALRYVQGGTVDGFLSVRLKPLAGTQVDTICWSALGIWGDAPVFDSKLQPLFGDAHSGKRPGYEHYEANAENLIKAGHCPLRLVTEFAHQNGIEAFASIRMNDVHDSFVPGIKTNWKRKHPEYLVKSDGEPAFTSCT